MAGSQRDGAVLRAVALFAVMANTAWAGGPAEVTLCKPAETVVFACDLGKRRVALCREPGADDAALVYRYGRPGRVELQHRAAPGGFWRSERPTYGGSELEVGFSRRGWDYHLYARTGRSAGATPEDRVPEAEDGLRVARSGSPGRRQACVDGGAGFRTSVTFVPAKP